MEKLISKKLNTTDGTHSVIEPGIYKFPLEFLCQRFSPNTYNFIDLHWHRGFQFCYIKTGNFVFKVLDCDISLTPGDALFINARQIHSAKPVDLEKESVYYSLNIPLYFLGIEGSEMYKKFVEPIVQNKNMPFAVFKKDDEKSAGILNLIRICGEKAVAQNGNFDLSLLSDIINLWDKLQKTTPPRNIKFFPKNNLRLQRILEFIRENYQYPISLQEIADSVGLSKSECSRFFKSVTGLNLFDYINQFRIEKTIDLLMNTDKSVTDIAYECGFQSRSYYNQRFKKVKGVNPLTFRKSE